MLSANVFYDKVLSCEMTVIMLTDYFLNEIIIIRGHSSVT